MERHPKIVIYDIQGTSSSQKSCWWLDSLMFWYQIDSIVALATYVLMRQTVLSEYEYIERLDLCNRRDPVACCELFTAFRIIYKFLEDAPSGKLLSNMAKSVLPIQPNCWHILEGVLLEHVDYQLVPILDSAMRWWTGWNRT